MLLAVVFVEAAIALYVLYMADRRPLFASWPGLGTLNGRYLSPAADALRIAYHAVAEAATKYLQIAAPQSVTEHDWHIKSIQNGGGHFHWHLAFEPSFLPPHDGVPLLASQVDSARFIPATFPVLLSAAFIVCGLLGLALRKKSSRSKQNTNTPLLPLTVADNTVYDFSSILDFGLATKDTDLYTPGRMSPHLYYPPGFAAASVVGAGDVAFRVDSSDNSPISDLENVLSGLDLFDLRNESRGEDGGAQTAVDLENKFGYTPIVSNASAGISETTAVSRYVSDAFPAETNRSSLDEDDRTTCASGEVKEVKSEIVRKTYKREKKSRMKTKLKKESALSCVTSPTPKDEENEDCFGVTNPNTTTTITANEIIATHVRPSTPTSTSFEDSGEASMYKTALEEAFSPAKKFLRELDTRMDRTRTDKKVNLEARFDESPAYKCRSRKPERVSNTYSKPTTSSIITPSFPKVFSAARSEVHTLANGKSVHTAETLLSTLQEVALAEGGPQDREARGKDEHFANRPRSPASGSGFASERVREIKGSGARSPGLRRGRGRADGLIGNSGKGAKLDLGGCGRVEKDVVVVGAPVARALALEVTPSLCADKEANPSANFQAPAAISSSTLPILTGVRANRYRRAKRLRATPVSDGMDTRTKLAKDRALDDAYTSIIASMGSATYLRDHLTKPCSPLLDALPTRPPLQHADAQWNWDAIWILREAAASSDVSDAGATVDGGTRKPEPGLRVVDAVPQAGRALDVDVAGLEILAVAATLSTGPGGIAAVDMVDSNDAGALSQLEFQTTSVRASGQNEEPGITCPKADDLRPPSVLEGPEIDGSTPALDCGTDAGAENLRQLSCEVPDPDHDHAHAPPNLDLGSVVAAATGTSSMKLKGGPSLGRHIPHPTGIKSHGLSLPPRSSHRNDVRREYLPVDVRKTRPVVTVVDKTEEEYGSDSDDNVPASLPLSCFFGFEESGYTLPEDDRELFESFNDWQDHIHGGAAESASGLQPGPVVAKMPRTGLADTSDPGRRSSLERDSPPATVSAADIKVEDLSLSLHEGDGEQEHAPEKISEICSVPVGDVDSGDCAGEDLDSDNEAGALLPLSSFCRFEESGIALPEDDRELFEPDNNWLAPVSSVTKSRPSAEHSSDDNKAELQDVDTMPVQDEISGSISEEIQAGLQDGQGKDREEAADWTTATGNSKAIPGDDFCSGSSDDADSALVSQNIEEVQVSDSDIGKTLALNFWPTEALIDTTLSGLYEVSGTFGQSYDGLIAVEDALDNIQDVLSSLIAMDSGTSEACVNASTSTSDLVQVCRYQQESNGESQEPVRLLVDVGTSVSDTELKNLTWDSATTYVSASTSTSALGQDQREGTSVYLNASTSTPAVVERMLSDMSTSISGVALNEVGVNTDTEPAADARAFLNAATSTSGLAMRDELFCKASCDTEVHLETSDLELASRHDEGLEDLENVPKEDPGASTLPSTPLVVVVGEEDLLVSGSTVGNSPPLGTDSCDSPPYRREYDFSSAQCTPTLVVDDSPCFDYLAKEKWLATDAVSSTPTPAALPTMAASRKAAGSRVSDLIARFQRPVQISTPAPRRAEASVSPYLPRTPSPLSSAPLCPVDFLQAQDNEAASPSPRALSPLLVPRCIIKVNGELRRTNLRAGLTDEIGERRAEGGSAKDKFSKEMLALLKRHNEKAIVNSS